MAPCGAQAGSEIAWAGAIALSLGRGALLAWLGTVVASLLVSAVGAGLLIARGSDDSKWHTVHVEFTYQLGHYRYTNRAALREGDWISKAGAEDLGDSWEGISRYAPGRRVTVYYDPAEPERSVLNQHDTSARGCYTVLALFCLTFIVGGVAAITWIVQQQPWRSTG